MIRANGLLDIEIKGDVEKVSPDNTVGLVETRNPEQFPESLLIDPERLERALIAVREEFDNPDNINIALVSGKSEDKKPDIALYPDKERHKAIVVAPRLRPDGDGGVEEGEIETVAADTGGESDDE